MSRKSRLGHLSRVVKLLRDREADLGSYITADPAGKQIPGFLAQLADYLAAEQSGCLKELSQLQKNIEHIKEIVSMQQAYAGSSGFKEPIDLREMAEDALRIHMAAMTRHDIRIEKEFFPIPSGAGRQAQGSANPGEPDQQCQARDERQPNPAR